MKRSPGEQVSGAGAPGAEGRPAGGVDHPGAQAPGRRVAPGDLHPGAVLGKYKIVKRLAGGGMGAVYEAVHTGIAKPVALKTINAALAADAVATTRFLREAAAASRLDHPHVVDVTDFGNDAGVGYLVMELLRGEDLAAVIGREPGGLKPQFVADVMLAVCAGVFAAHESGVVHRDLKPQNIFLAQTPLGEMVPKVLDFGISKRIDDDVKSGLTHSGAVMGTTHYLSPEQVAGKPLDVRSDQYALGVILYEALTSKRPHEGDSAYAIMQSIGEGRFALPRLVRTEIPPGLEAVVVRSMSLRPQDRFESVHGLGRALLPFASSKRRVIWSDYYQQDRPPVTSAPPSGYAKLPVPAVGEEGGTVVIDLKKEKRSSLAKTQTRLALPAERLAAAPPPAARSRASDDTGKEVVPVPVIGTDEYLRTSMARRRGSSRFVVALGLVIAGAGAYMLWVDPSWRNRLPQSLRQRIDRAMPPDKRPPEAPNATLTPDPPATEATPASAEVVLPNPVAPTKPEGKVVLPQAVPVSGLASETAPRPPSPLAPEIDAAPPPAAAAAAANAGTPAPEGATRPEGAAPATAGDGTSPVVAAGEDKPPPAQAVTAPVAEKAAAPANARPPGVRGRLPAGAGRQAGAVKTTRRRAPPPRPAQPAASAQPTPTAKDQPAQPAKEQPPAEQPHEENTGFPMRPKSSPGGAPILE
jgi:eukaryotic-like serine/threonine-protein kinase